MFCECSTEIKRYRLKARFERDDHTISQMLTGVYIMFEQCIKRRLNYLSV